MKNYVTQNAHPYSLTKFKNIYLFFISLHIIVYSNINLFIVKRLKLQLKQFITQNFKSDIMSVWKFNTIQRHFLNAKQQLMQ